MLQRRALTINGVLGRNSLGSSRSRISESLSAERYEECIKIRIWRIYVLTIRRIYLLTIRDIKAIRMGQFRENPAQPGLSLMPLLRLPVPESW